MSNHNRPNHPHHAQTPPAAKAAASETPPETKPVETPDPVIDDRGPAIGELVRWDGKKATVISAGPDGYTIEVFAVGGTEMQVVTKVPLSALAPIRSAPEIQRGVTRNEPDSSQPPQ